jgi:hypothetical protein
LYDHFTVSAIPDTLQSIAPMYDNTLWVKRLRLWPGFLYFHASNGARSDCGSMRCPLLVLLNTCFTEPIRVLHTRRGVPTMAPTALLPARRNECGRVYMRSPRIRCPESTHTYSVNSVTVMHASVLDADIMKMIIICRRAAWCTSAPPRIAPVIIPGMEMRPITLRFMKATCEPGGWSG